MTPEQRGVLAEWKDSIAAAGADSVLTGYGGHDGSAPPAPGPQQTIARFFGCGEEIQDALLQAIAPPEVISALEEHGLVRRAGDRVSPGDYRLVYHAGLFLFCHRAFRDGRLYYGSDSLLLSRALLPVEGTVLDLCAGAGAQSLVCARTATAVTAIDIEPLAESAFWVNAALNGLSERVEYFIGDLYGPVKGRRFDRICCNPPFLPAPPDFPLARYAWGGPDGLAVVQEVLAGLPEFLAPGGKCQIIGSMLGNDNGPDASALERLAARHNLSVEISCFGHQVLDEAAVASFAAASLDSPRREAAGEAYRVHFAQLGATQLYYFVLTATPNERH